jgi:hypothetical protein
MLFKLAVWLPLLSFLVLLIRYWILQGFETHEYFTEERIEVVPLYSETTRNRVIEEFDEDGK